ncbi:MAG: L-threonylcarbamoyladenylate synthase [Paraglaciecola sp.]|jgi:L-threonylcarbamoyladenylate synthase
MSKIDKIITCLQGGGVVLIPTDTVYGLAVKPGDEVAAQRLYELKSRPPRLNLPIMVASKEDIEKLGIEVNATADKLLKSSFMPGALTLIMGFKNGKRAAWLAGREEVAIRIPNDEQLLAILRKAGPLLVTSANKSGNPTPTVVPQILKELNGKPDLTIDGGTVEVIPSTIINCRTNPPKIEREGKIPAADLFDFLVD